MLRHILGRYSGFSVTQREGHTQCILMVAESIHNQNGRFPLGLGEAVLEFGPQSSEPCFYAPTTAGLSV